MGKHGLLSDTVELDTASITITEHEVCIHEVTILRYMQLNILDSTSVGTVVGTTTIDTVATITTIKRIYHAVGIERSVVYINHTDIVRVIHRYDPSDEAYERWLAQKYPEYVAYYENGNPENRPDIDTMRAMTLNARDREYRKNKIKKLARYTCMGFCTLGVGLTILLTNRWEMAVGALFFIFLGMGMKK